MGYNLDSYEDVDSRIHAFYAAHPDGRITTRMEHQFMDDTGVLVSVIVSAAVYRNDSDPQPAGTGLAQEQRTDRGVNAISALENCETSAIGRALANIGYSAKGARPSREEMEKVAAHDAASQAPGRVVSDQAPATTPPVAVATPPHPYPSKGGEGHTNPLHAAVDLVVEQLGGGVVETVEAPSPTTAGDPTGAARADNAKRIGARFGVDPKFAGSRKPSSEKQHAMLGKLFTDIGITENTKRLTYVRNLLERPDIGGAGELLSGEASVLIDALKLDADKQAEQGKQSTFEDPWASEPAWA